ncbi:flagellar biosynthesis protein [Clostridium gasigenes]|uniref:TIGR02530 family flagellar biosynthesis protein n=1 Tax=Clostridium gasigenes TaxID=94869 RepID=UPI0016285CD1|nr:TIGR02530 family flagellar biosynthesis protein [Clostridium gasigenes]MBB6624234.1 flagellar biosynthesis protein [Clostridium gasigenes]MBU3089311.1 flagellar biosynthesis protein [Clostridium gasigenes]
MGFRIVDGRAYPVGNFPDVSTGNAINQNKLKNSNRFKDILDKTIEKNRGYTLSKHAADRLKEINFNEQDMDAIGKGFKIAEAKGAKNSVIMYKDVALIASIENKTIITAVEKERAKENIFTNIDSVVIL